MLHAPLPTLDPLDAATSRALLASARALRCSEGSDSLLRGKHIALICEAGAAGADLFVDAATRLGARVSRIEPAQLWLDGQLCDDAVRLLEHLYDAVDCEAMPARFARQLQAMLGVPVYDGLGSTHHAILGLLAAWAPAEAADAEASVHRLLVQAALVNSLL